MNDTYNWRALLRLAHLEFARRLAAVTDWDGPTPDTEWRVRDLVTHVIDEQRDVPALLAGVDPARARADLEPLREDLRGEWELYSLAAAGAWAATPDDAEVHLSDDTVSAAEFLRERVSDVTIHTWDLARAIGADEQLEDELIAAVWTVFEPQAETLAATSLFAHPVTIPDDAPLQSRLLALTGRDPR